MCARQFYRWITNAVLAWSAMRLHAASARHAQSQCPMPAAAISRPGQALGSTLLSALQAGWLPVPHNTSCAHAVLGAWNPVAAAAVNHYVAAPMPATISPASSSMSRALRLVKGRGMSCAHECLRHDSCFQGSTDAGMGDQGWGKPHQQRDICLGAVNSPHLKAALAWLHRDSGKHQ